MTILLLGTEFSGKRTFIEKIGGVLIALHNENQLYEYQINNQYLFDTIILASSDDMDGAAENAAKYAAITLVIIMSVVGHDPMVIFHAIKDTVSCPIIIVFNKTDLERMKKNEYLLKSAISKVYKSKADMFFKKTQQIRKNIRKYDLPVYKISCNHMTTDEIFQTLEIMGAPAPLQFKRAGADADADAGENDVELEL